MRLCSGVAALACVLIWSGAAGAAGAEAEAAPGRDPRDLAYREVLFHYYSGDQAGALTRMLAGQARGELPVGDPDLDLLRGAIYLSAGQHRIAGEIFTTVLAGSVSPEVHDRAWLFLAKTWHQRGYFTEAEAALGRIGSALPAEFEPERRLLAAQVLLDQGRYDSALAALQAWPAHTEGQGYAKYNIAVALVRLGRLEEGARVLAEVGAMGADAPESAALSDKANVALGYTWLQAERPADARPALERVRLDGPYSNKALLGVGWANAEQGNYRGALAPWLELRGRSLADSAVQEALLAVPYAFEQLGAAKQAADYYVDAIEIFGEELARLDASAAVVADGSLVAALLDDVAVDERAWYRRFDRIPESTESRYLYQLMATNEFQQGLSSYRDLLSLSSTADAWRGDLEAFDHILDARARAFAERAPVIDNGLARVDFDALAARRDALEAQLAQVERSAEFAALATPDQQRAWAELTAMEPQLAQLGTDPRAEDLRNKHRLLKGVIAWDLERDYPARLWAEQTSLRELDREIREAQRRYGDVATARAEWPARFATETARIDELHARVGQLQTSAAATLERERAYLRALAVDALDVQRARLSTYLAHARFALADIYDRATDGAGLPAAGENVGAETRPEVGAALARERP